jgi:putative transposase
VNIRYFGLFAAARILNFFLMESDLPSRKHPVHFASVERHNRAIIQFVTICTHLRQPVLANEISHERILAAWKEAGEYAVGRYVVMPDHIHLFCAPAVWPPSSLSGWVRFWKSRIASAWQGRVNRKLWQRDYWDRQLRSGESYGEKWEYVVQNPVRAGLVTCPEDWPYQGEINALAWHD